MYTVGQPYIRNSLGGGVISVGGFRRKPSGRSTAGRGLPRVTQVQSSAPLPCFDVTALLICFFYLLPVLRIEKTNKPPVGLSLPHYSTLNSSNERSAFFRSEHLLHRNPMFASCTGRLQASPLVFPYTSGRMHGVLQGFDL